MTITDWQYVLLVIPAAATAICSIIAAWKGMQNGRKLDDHAAQLSDINANTQGGPTP